MIITNDLIKKALKMARPTAEKFLATEGMTWGPKWVEGYVRVIGIDDIRFVFGKRTEWNTAWGPENKTNFSEKAMEKLEIAERFNCNTSFIMSIAPWLDPKEACLYPGGSSSNGISVGVSGAKGWVDEAIARIVIVCISTIALTYFETDKQNLR